MKKSEVSLLLATAAAYDRRTSGDADVKSWHAAIGDLDSFDDANQAVIDHYAFSTEWLKPAHVRAGVRRIRAARLANVDRALPAADPDARDYTQALREQIKAVADGRQVRLALASGGRAATGPTAEYAAARGADYARRRAALSVACPVAACAQPQGRACRVIGGGRRPVPEGYHQPRLEAARAALNADVPAPAEEPAQPPVDTAAAPAAPALPPYCGRCHAETRTRMRLAGEELHRVPCPACHPQTIS
ncbi:hypothetical protein [Streptomonospora litoralis]|uniref:Uncharacterized protein n=1 Tax=Streptomonospora litoralis TaxID=2498135 RepID=A0A4P6Q7Y8_9ACTN|nr:hypothetical protein [Streptomonospora litoralis]QBI56853.1 hypothetical protein EKD16_25565 [Streptomonospora litoralis]